MTDLSIVLPDLSLHEHQRLIPSLEKHLITTTDLITLDAVEIAKRAQLPILDLRRLCNAVLHALQRDLHVRKHDDKKTSGLQGAQLKIGGKRLVEQWHTISTLNESIDTALNGGISTGCITEVTGESGAGKTQFLLTLLLSVQLPTPHGLSRSALYISTESPLATSRLSQMLATHPVLMKADPKPSLDRVISIMTPDLESQDHILHFQVPVVIKRHNVGLIIIDSIAANYRAEFERPGASRNGANMAKRSSELISLGTLLRKLARIHNLVVVVANQVADRFSITSQSHGAFAPQHVHSSPIVHTPTQESPLAYRTTSNSMQLPAVPGSELPSSLSSPSSYLPEFVYNPIDNPLTLDHQQRWFTGWGDDLDHFSDPTFQPLPQKTPSLGLVWTTQIACRLALLKTPVYDVALSRDDDGGETVLKYWRRYFKVVFSAWAKPSRPGTDGAIELEITAQGLVSVEKGKDRDREEESTREADD